MTEPWIRVHANIASRPLIGRAMLALKVRENEAIGLMVRFWGAVSQHVVNGDITDVPDATIEGWAGWKRRSGIFAAFVRGSHLDADGRVKEWDDYAGKLEQRRAKDRERKARGIPAESTRNSSGTPQDITRDSIPARAVRDVTIRNEELQTPGTVKTAKRELPPYDQIFLESWGVYPKRPGNSKSGSWRQWLARVREGVDPLDMLAGTRSYALRCERERTDPGFVKMAQTFFGQDRHFASDWGPVAGPDPTPAEVIAGVMGVPVERVLQLWAEEDQGLAIAQRHREVA